MSDDPSRPTSGPQSDPYPAASAPEWWGALDRGDLPLDGELREEIVGAGTAPAATHTPPRLADRPRRAVRWRMVGFNAAVLVVVILIVCVGVGVVSPSMFLTMALIFGVPLALSAATVTVIARRSR